jgi:hypothetical protein
MRWRKKHNDQKTTSGRNFDVRKRQTLKKKKTIYTHITDSWMGLLHPEINLEEPSW